MRYIPALAISLTLLCPGVALALVNINTASLAELDTLPGVGPATAEKIVDTRPFSSTTDIQNVQGIGGPGSKTYEAIINLITVSGTTEVVMNETDDTADVVTANQQAAVSSVGGTKEVRPPVSGLTLTAPNVAYAGQLLDLDVNPNDGTDGRLVRYFWNFGDGHVSTEKNPSHQYVRPGKYVIMVESYFQKTTKTARRELTVLPLQLGITPLAGGGIEIINQGSQEIDLGGMSLNSTGTFVFPKHTILLAGASLIVESVSGPGALLTDEFGKSLVFNTTPTANVPATIKTSTPIAARPKSTPTASAEATSTVSSKEDDQAVVAQTAAVSNSKLPATTWPYLGLLAVVSVGFVALFGTRRS